MLAPVTHILPLTNIRRSRTLPFPGRVLVRAGQKVQATDVIAQAEVPSGHMVMDVRRALGISRAKVAEQAIVRQQGDKLEKGDVIAESGGLFSKIMRAPVNSEIVSIFNGQVLLRTRTSLVEVKAGFTGTVVDLLQDQGAVIETNGALIQGVWGNGRIESGMLVLLARTPDEELARQNIDVSMRGMVVFGGHCSDPDALRAGNDMQLRGLVLASMSADLISVANSVNFPVFVIEGFGKISLNEVAFKLLMTSEKRDVSLNAAFQPAIGEHPEFVIPLPALGQSTPETDQFKAGQLVRIQGVPYAGQTGYFVQARQGLFTLSNGLKVPAADVQLDGDTRVTVPLANLEVIE